MFILQMKRLRFRESLKIYPRSHNHATGREAMTKAQIES